MNPTDFTSDPSDAGGSSGLSPSNIQGAAGAGGLGLGVLGIVGGLLEGNKSSGIASQEAMLSQQNASYEEQITGLRQQQMNLFGQRQMMENFRNTQKAKAQGMAASVQSGSQYGSGIRGAQAAETSEGARNQLQLNQDLEIGNTIFGTTRLIDQNKIKMAGLQSQLASSQGSQDMFKGIMQLGQGIMQAAGPMGMMLGV